MTRAAAAAVGLIVAAHVTPPVTASLYQADARASLVVRADGTPEPLPFDEFKRRLSVLTNQINPTLETEDRLLLKDRVEKLRRQTGRSATQDAALAADLLRLGDSPAALNLLGPRTRDRNPEYRVFATLAHVHAARGEWAEALTYLRAAAVDCPPPAGADGVSKSQVDWQLRLDRDHVLPLFRLLRDEAAAKPPPEDEDVPPLFPVQDRKQPQPPVRFANDAGRYEPGHLAAAERAKLPPDAVAVVQQLLLWFPDNTRLYWLLAELYAADGKLDEAAKIFDECAWSRQYGNRKRMMDHRAAVKAVLEERAEQDKKAEQTRIEEQMRPISLTVYLYGGAVAAIVAAVLARTAMKWVRGG